MGGAGARSDTDIQGSKLYVRGLPGSDSGPRGRRTQQAPDRKGDAPLIRVGWGFSTSAVFLYNTAKWGGRAISGNPIRRQTTLDLRSLDNVTDAGLYKPPHSTLFSEKIILLTAP